MFHTFDPEARFTLTPARFKTTKEIADALTRLISQFPSSNRTVPVVGKTRRSRKELEDNFATLPGPSPNVTAEPGDPFMTFWGRLQLERLVRYFAQYHDTESSFEYLDLGTPVFLLGSGSPQDQECARLLPFSGDPPAAGGSATVGAAIIDMGEQGAPGTLPDSYGGQLRHVVTRDISLSDHAEKVLSILLNRLQSNGDLGVTTVSCALIRPPTGFIGTGLPAFDQACTPEMLTAIAALEPHLTADGLPAAVNMSLGTHVGPHNGESPLEEYIATTLSKTDRYLVVAAGNEGGVGHSAKCALEADEPEFLNVTTGPLCTELLVEFWWEDSGSANPLVDLSIEVDIWETVIAAGTVTRTNHGTLQVDSTTAGTLLSRAPAGLPTSMVMHSLFSTRCQKNFSCAAFAISSTAGITLPVLQVTLKLLAKRQVMMNGWIVVAEADPLTGSTGFVEGGAEGNITVPASDPTVLSVAGLDSSGKIWKRSSRGPAAHYDTVRPRTNSPLMAHLSHLGSDFGTSFASPRACADAVGTLANVAKRSGCTNAESLLRATYPTSLAVWNSRFGFHKQLT